jgi:hypothetical protein
LIGATIAHAEDRGLPQPFVRDFIAEFAGLSGTAKRREICEKLGAQRLTLAEFFANGGEGVRDLLFAMREASRPVKPDALGLLGKDHLLRGMAEVGAHPETFAYRRTPLVADDGLPHVAEVAFAWAPEAEARKFVAGLNFSPVIGSNPFRTLGSYGSLDGLLEHQPAGADEPVVLAMPLRRPFGGDTLDGSGEGFRRFIGQIKLGLAAIEEREPRRRKMASGRSANGAPCSVAGTRLSSATSP